MDNSVFFRAFKQAGLLKACLFKPGTAGERSFDAELQRPDVLLLGDEALATDYQLEFQTADLPPVRIDVAISVSGVAYVTAGHARAHGDGFFSVVALNKV